jgi:hypothetical protein
VATKVEVQIFYRNTVVLELKIKIIGNFVNGQTVTSPSRKFDLATSTVKTITEDGESIKDHVKSSAPLISKIITKKRTDAFFEMENL